MGFFMHALKLFCFLFLVFQPQITCSSSSLFSSHHVVLCSRDQSLALLQFKNMHATGYCGDHTEQTYSWKEGVDCCLWDGVTCDNKTGNVIGLDLTCSGLEGTIHSNSTLFHLSHLQKLSLSSNWFESHIFPPKFGGFPNLTHLNLSLSWFYGKIPVELSQLSRLVSLDLSYNPLELEISAFKPLVKNLTQLRELNLMQVNMSSVPPSLLLNLSSSLTSLGLDDVGMLGNFPAAYILRLPNLRLLQLKYNYGLTGSLPESNWTSSLRILDLDSCQFTGSLPTSMGNLTQIIHIDLSRNSFSGEIPASSFSNLAQLDYFSLEENNFEGQIPDAFDNLSKLTHVSLGRNGLTGQLPSSVFNLTQLSYLDFSQNHLVGPFPEYASGLSKLVYLNLSSNFLNGTIPPWLLSLPSLESLFLQNNLLTGSISEMTTTSLFSLDLSNNKLYGPIPRLIFEFENITELYLSTNNLSGVVELEKFSKLGLLEFVDFSGNSLLSVNTTNNFNHTQYITTLYGLFLSSCNIKEFPPVLKVFTNIVNLDLSYNKIHGEVPQWFFELGTDSLQTLVLSNNYLTKIQQLPWTGLSKLDLRGNLLEGELPIPPPLVAFYSVARNNLTGEVSSLFCHLVNLEVLDLYYNNLSGKVPHCIGNASSSFSVLNLRMNSFEGTIPKELGSNLRSLNFNGNRFGGSLPRSLVNCSKLEVLDVGNNKMHGIFPYWLETLPDLQVLVLRSNNFYGFVRGSKTKNLFPKLKIFDLSKNNFSGPFPTRHIKNFEAMINSEEPKSGKQYIGQEGRDNPYTDSLALTIKGREMELVKILTILTTIDLSDNKFQGQIPQIIGELKSLKGLVLSHNNFSGHIPSSIGSLTNLEWLDLSSNNLSGEIPKELVSLTYLSFLNLSWNRLIRDIPQGQQFNTFGNDSFQGNLGLCGFPLTKNCTDNDVEEGSQLPQEDETKNESVFNWVAISLGYAFGVVYGVVMGYFIFNGGRQRWLLCWYSWRRIISN